MLVLDHPAIRLLRADQAAFALSFLHMVFKESGQNTLAEDTLAVRLANWMAARREEGDFVWELSAKDYLDDWTSEKKAWLRKVVQPDETPGYELTAATEKALTWIESLQSMSFVGTESRLETIFSELDDLLRQASDDVGERLAWLTKERDELDEEIRRLALGGSPRTYEPWQVNERYARLLEEARTLTGDFRQVEENFRKIAQEVVERRASAESNKGEIVGRVLDSHDSVRESPQGRSFYGFVRLLLDPDRRERFEGQLGKVTDLTVLSPELKESPFLRQLLPRLRTEQEKVGASTQRLSANLRRALETARLAERRRVSELVSEIQQLALRALPNPPARADFFEVEEMPSYWPGASRPLWEEGILPNMGLQFDEAGSVLDLEGFARLKNLPHLSLEHLRSQIEVCLQDQNHVLLKDVLDRFPLDQGIMEIIGYIILAARPPHYLSWSETDAHLIDGQLWHLPRIMFMRELEAVAA